MPIPVLMPKLGMSMAEGRVVEWLVEIGGAVAKGAPLLLIESEKAEVEIEATMSGVLRHIYIEPGETVPCGTLLAAVTDTADEPFDPDEFATAHAPKDAPVKQPAGSAKTSEAAPARPRDKAPVTPAARRRAKELDVDLARVAGTGPGERITIEDVEQAAAQRENLVQVGDGVALEVLTDGAGEPVLLLPGFGTDASMFALQTPVLTSSYRVSAVNPRGVGASDAPEADAYDVADLARDAAAVLDEPAHVIGASLGAAVALELALQQPERVRSLTLITPFLTASARLLAICDGWGAAARETTPATLARIMLPWFFSSDYLANRETAERTTRGLAQTFGRVSADALERYAAGLARWSGARATDAQRVAVPTLVIGAAGDLLTPDAEAVARAIPGAGYVSVPTAGHAVCIEAAEAVTAALLDHLAACKVNAT